MSTTSAPPTPKHRRSPKYRLRALLISLTVVGVWLGSCIYRIRQQAQAVAAICSAGGDVIYEDSGPIAAGWRLQLREVGYDETRRPAPAWLRGWIGRDFTSRVVGVSFEADERHNLRYPRSFTGPVGSRVNPWYPDPEPAHMVHLTPGLLRQMGSLKDLTSLYLAETDVDDVGIEYLKSLPHLKYVALGSLVSEKGVGSLRDAIPDVSIDY